MVILGVKVIFFLLKIGSKERKNRPKLLTEIGSKESLELYRENVIKVSLRCVG